jgi:hypothetical protein
MTWHDQSVGGHKTVKTAPTERNTDKGRGDIYRRRWWTLAVLSVSLLIIIIDDTIIIDSFTLG